MGLGQGCWEEGPQCWDSSSRRKVIPGSSGDWCGAQLATNFFWQNTFCKVMAQFAPEPWNNTE